jgi:hypothetical protein
MSNFHGQMSSKTFTIPNNTFVIVPFGAGLINVMSSEEKKFFLQNKDTIIESFNKNTGKAISIFGKNFMILQAGDKYCDVRIELQNDYTLDEGLYELNELKKMLNDPLYRTMNFGDVLGNPLEQKYLLNFNIKPVYKEIVKLYIHNQDEFIMNTEYNLFNSDKKTYAKNIIEKLRTIGRKRMYRLEKYTDNYDLVVNNINRILYPYVEEKTKIIFKNILDNLFLEIKELEIPKSETTANPELEREYNFCNNEIQLLKNAVIKFEQIEETERNYQEEIITLYYNLSTILDRLMNKGCNKTHNDNYNLIVKMYENFINNIKHQINYDVIFKSIYSELFMADSEKKINIVDVVSSNIDDTKSYKFIVMVDNKIDEIGKINIYELMENNMKGLTIYDIIEKSKKCKHFREYIFIMVGFTLVKFRQLSTFSEIHLDFYKNFLSHPKNLYLSDVINQVNKFSDKKKIIFSRSCQGLDNNMSNEQAGQCLKYTTDFNFSNVFNQNNINNITETIKYIKDKKLSNIVDEYIPDQYHDLHYDIVCIYSKLFKNTDLLVKVFILYLSQNFIEIFNSLKYSLNLSHNNKEEQKELMTYQQKIFVLMLNLYIKSVYDSVNDEEKENINKILFQ